MSKSKYVIIAAASVLSVCYASAIAQQNPQGGSATPASPQNRGESMSGAAGATSGESPGGVITHSATPARVVEPMTGQRDPLSAQSVRVPWTVHDSGFIQE